MPDSVKLIDLIPSQIRWKTYLKTCSLALLERENEKEQAYTSQGPILGLQPSAVHLGSWTDRQKDWLLKSAQFSALEEPNPLP